MLTSHCSAASGMVVPPSIVPTTRLRRSSEYGFAIHAGLLPADSLNHVRTALGIPDSAFPGNALRLRKQCRGLSYAQSRRPELLLVALHRTALETPAFRGTGSQTILPRSRFRLAVR